MSQRMNHDSGVKARVAVEALKGDRTVSGLAAAYEVHPSMIHQRKKALLRGPSESLSVLVRPPLQPRSPKVRFVICMPRSESRLSPTIFWQ